MRALEIEEAKLTIARRRGQRPDGCGDAALPICELGLDADQPVEFEAPGMHRHDDEIDIDALEFEFGEAPAKPVLRRLHLSRWPRAAQLTAFGGELEIMVARNARPL